MTLWEFLKFLAHLDVSPEIGWNFFSLICFGLMFAYGFARLTKIYNPLFKLKALPLVLSSAACTLLFYYSVLDMPANFIYGLLTGGVAEAFISHLNVRRLPANIPALLIYSVFVLLLTRKYLRFKWFAVVFGIQQVFIVVVMLTFGTFNMRYLDPDARTLFYVVFTIPGWVFWLIGYKLFWKTEKEITKMKIKEAA